MNIKYLILNKPILTGEILSMTFLKNAWANKKLLKGVFLSKVLTASAAGLVFMCSQGAHGQGSTSVPRSNDSHLQTKEILGALNRLAQYEIDASYLLSQASDNINNDKIREELINFKLLTERNNIAELSALIKRYGGTPPSHSRTFKGFFMQGYAAMRGMATDRGLLEALHTNLSFGKDAYDNVLKLDLPSDVKNEVEKLSGLCQKKIDYVVTEKRALAASD